MDKQDPLIDAHALWEASAAQLRSLLGDGTWRTWLDGVQAQSFDAGALVLTVPSALARQRIESAYGDIIADTVSSTAGMEVQVDLIVQTEPRSESEVVVPTTQELELLPARPAETLGGDRAEDASHSGALLNPRYTFEQFVIGASNRFAWAAAMSVAEKPGQSYNPLFIYGPSGLGKTHLLQAVGHAVKTLFPFKRVRYVSTETFMNEFVEMIRTNAHKEFKRTYRDVDLLLVDDVQFLQNHERLQEEFFHTFDSLHTTGGQIVLSSDRSPKAMSALVDRLRTRFEQGLITDIQPPEFETRLAILRHKARNQGFSEITDDALSFIATHIADNVRELEGALIRVAAFSSLSRTLVTEDLARQVLSDILKSTPTRKITPELILEETAKMFGWTIEELCGRSRRRPLVTARQIGMYVFRELTDYSYPQIAKEFGGRDHTTVMHAVEKITGQMAERVQIYEQVTELISRIKTGDAT